MALGKWCGCVWMAVFLSAMIDLLHNNNAETPEEDPLIGPEDTWTLINAYATFTCLSPLGSCVNMTWYIGISFYLWSDFNPIDSNRSQIVNRSIVENTTSGCKLTITDVKFSDSRLFYCEIEIGNGSLQGRTAELTVVPDADALKVPSSNSSIVGQNVSFTCVSRLKNCVGMNWFKDIPGSSRFDIFSDSNDTYHRDKYVVENSTVGCRLTIRHVELIDTGVVYCQFERSKKTIERSAFLFVFATPQQSPLSGPDDSLNFVDTNAVFTCRYPLRSCLDVTWYISRRISTQTVYLPIWPHDDRYVVKSSTLGCKLTIRSVQRNESGSSYYCEIRMGRRAFQGRTARLLVIREVNALRRLFDDVIIVGQNATFNCLSPLGNCVGMNWYKDLWWTKRHAIFNERNGIYLRDKYTVENITKGCRLTVHHVDFTDHGSVFCEIQISHRLIEKSAVLYVVARGQNPIKGPEDVLTLNDTNAIFTCISPYDGCYNMTFYKEIPDAFGSHFVPIIRSNPELRDRCILETLDVGCKLTITNVQYRDTGKVYCKIDVRNRSLDSRYAELVVTTPDFALRGIRDYSTSVGSDAYFTCVSPLKNCIGVNWYKDMPGLSADKIVSEPDGVYSRSKYSVGNTRLGCQLIIRSVELTDSGLVYCQNQISGRLFEKTASLDVFEPMKGPENSLSFIGTSAVFICISHLRSCVNLTWFKDSYGEIRFFEIDSRDSPQRDRCIFENTTRGCKLTVTNVQLSDTGYVYCEIKVAGRPFRGRTANFTVIDSTEADVLIGPSDSTNADGDNVTFTCASAVASCLHMKWYKDMPSVSRVPIFSEFNTRRDRYKLRDTNEGCQLTIIDVQVLDTGRVYCEIEISQRRIERSAFLSVALYQ